MDKHRMVLLCAQQRKQNMDMTKLVVGTVNFNQCKFYSKISFKKLQSV